MGVKSVPAAEALFQADTLAVSCHSQIRVLLPALKPMEGKNIQFHSQKVAPLTNPPEVTDQDSATVTLTPGDGTTAIKVESLA